MTTKHAYMVRKPSDLEEVVSTSKSHINDTETLIITETIELSPKDYQALTKHPLHDYPYLMGKGGYNNVGQRTAVAITCAGKLTLLIDPSGSSYARYMGVADD